MLWSEFPPLPRKVTQLLHFFQKKDLYYISLRIPKFSKTMKCWLAQPQCLLPTLKKKKKILTRKLLLWQAKSQTEDVMQVFF